MPSTTSTPSVAEALAQKHEDERKTRAREEIRQDVTRARDWGKVSPRYVKWAFEDAPDELAELNREVQRLRTQKQDDQERRTQAAELRAATKQVLKEWDEAERAKRYSKAEAEAKRRLASAEGSA